MSSPSIHANALIVQNIGILIRGASRSGKSRLTVALLDAAHEKELPAALVGDDRIFLEVVDGQLLAKGHPAILGKIEIRGYGIVALDFVAQARIRLLVDLVPDTKNVSAGFKPFSLREMPVERIEFAAHSSLADMLMVILEKIGKTMTEM